MWELQQVIEVVHLFAEEGFEITREAAYPLIHTMDRIEKELSGKSRHDAIVLLIESAAELHNGIRVFHFAVTGEAVDY